MFKNIFKFVLIIFYLYLIGDAFYRWDGFRYYATFSEFLPSVALVTILWSLIALFVTACIWLPLILCNKIFQCRIRWEDIILLNVIVIITGLSIWGVKRYFLPHLHTTQPIRIAILIFIIILSVFLTWLSRDRFSKWIDKIQENITPLFWISGGWLIISILLISYSTFLTSESPNTLLNDHNPPSKIDPNKEKINIILLTFDALSAEEMSLYGYHRLTTPFISKWAQNAYVFTRAEAAGNFTPSTVASLMTGKRVWTHQTYHLFGSKPVKGGTENLPFLLKSHGYRTIAFVVNPVASVNVLGISKSFDIAPLATEFSIPVSLFRREETVEFGLIDRYIYQLFGNKIRLYDWFVQKNFAFGWFINAFLSDDNYQTSVPPKITFDKFLQLIKDTKNIEPFFAWIHLLPPHTPYLPPEPYWGIFDMNITQNSDVDLKRIKYDEFIRYCDDQFQYFIEQLSKLGILNRTVIILSSDHGESFEHDYIGHGGYHLYEQVTHIPLIIKEPNQKTGKVIDDLVEQIDIPATILDLAGIPIPSWMEGRSLVPLMRGEKLPPKYIFSMDFKKNPSRGNIIKRGTIAIWKDNYKLIHYLDENKALLFNLKEDPSELKNLFDIKSEIGKELLFVIKKNLKEANERILNSKL